MKVSTGPLDPHPFLSEHSVQDWDQLGASLIITSPLEMQQADVNLILMWQDGHTDGSI